MDRQRQRARERPELRPDTRFNRAERGGHFAAFVADKCVEVPAQRGLIAVVVTRTERNPTKPQADPLNQPYAFEQRALGGHHVRHPGVHK